MPASTIEMTVTSFPPRAKAITPANNTPLRDNGGNVVAMMVFVGVGGNVNVLPAGNPAGSTVIFAVPTGGYVPVQVAQVLSTSTTASSLVGCW